MNPLLTDNGPVAAEGHVFVCLACGKMSDSKYGTVGRVHPGWDEACMLNAVELPKDKLVIVADRVLEVME